MLSLVFTALAFPRLFNELQDIRWLNLVHSRFNIVLEDL
jgi:hypothetical protein